MYAKAVIVGNLVRQPEVKYLGANKTPVAEFSLAISENKKEGDGWKETSHFFDCVCFNQAAERMSGYDKGTTLLVDAGIQQDRWEDKDGNKRSKVKFVVNYVRVLKQKQAADGSFNPSGFYDEPEKETVPATTESSDVPWG